MRQIGMLAAVMGVVSLAACGDPSEQIARPSEPSFNFVPTVVLSGPTDADPNHSCTWTATASGGTGPYTFSWDWHLARGDVTGTVGYSSEFYGHVAGDYMFAVTVTDANNVVAVDTLYRTPGGTDC